LTTTTYIPNEYWRNRFEKPNITPVRWLTTYWTCCEYLFKEKNCYKHSIKTISRVSTFNIGFIVFFFFFIINTIATTRRWYTGCYDEFECYKYICDRLDIDFAARFYLETIHKFVSFHDDMYLIDLNFRFTKRLYLDV